ncbi:HIT family protein [bacterium]|nr:HIT family protein [bacterium]
MENCIFCKIVAGEIPCYKIFENEKILAFLDINPAVPGHVLVIPKKHFTDIFEIDDQYLQELIVVAKRIAEKMKTNFDAGGVNLFQSNGENAEQTVFHFHLHLLPRKGNDRINFSELLVNAEKIDNMKLEEIKKILGE